MDVAETGTPWEDPIDEPLEEEMANNQFTKTQTEHHHGHTKRKW